MYGKMQTSGLHEFIPFICTSAIWGQICFPVHRASCIPLVPQQSLSGVAASPGSQFGELSFTFEGQKSLLSVKFLVYLMARDIFISQIIFPNL